MNSDRHSWSRVGVLGLGVSGLGFRAPGFNSGVSGFGFQVSGFGFRVSVPEFRFGDTRGLRVEGSGLGVQDLRFMV